MSKHYDTLETRSPAEREKALMQALPLQVAQRAFQLRQGLFGLEGWRRKAGEIVVAHDSQRFLRL